MMFSNSTPQIKAGEKFDSGQIFIDANGVKRTIYFKTLATGALGNATAITIPHGESVDVTAGAFLQAEVVATNGTNSVDNNAIEVAVDATNLVITSTGDLSAFDGIARIAFIAPLA